MIKSLSTLISLLILSSVAQAKVVAVHWTGEVSTNFTDLRGGVDALDIGTIVNGVFTYETDTTIAPIDANRARYDQALLSHQVTIEGQVFNQVGTGSIFVTNDDEFGLTDKISSANTTFGRNQFIDGMIAFNQANFAFTDTTGLILDSLDLPGEIDLTNYDRKGIVISFGRFDVPNGPFTLYSLQNIRFVPEPSASVLSVLAMTLVGSVRSRYSKIRV